MIRDKSGIFTKNKINSEWIELELGCGQNKKNNEAIGIDQLDFPGVDIVGDALEVLRVFPDNSVNKIYSNHFFEHLNDIKDMIVECSRILKKGGEIVIVVPHFSNPYFYSDYTHKTPFGLYTFSYLCNAPAFRRKVPKYNIDLPLTIKDIYLNFRGERPFYIRHAIGRILSKIINSCTYAKEFYEINLCYLIPCHEIRITIEKND